MTIPSSEFDKRKEALDTLTSEGVFDLRNASAEIFFDDVGLIQEIVMKRRKRKEPNRELIILHTKKTHAELDYDEQGTLQQIVYTTKWRRKLPPTSQASH